MKLDRKTVESLCCAITSGGTPSTKEASYYDGEIPWLRTQEVNFNFIQDTEIKITEDGFANSSAKWIPENSVIVALYGNSSGRVAINRIPLTTNQACGNFTIDPQKADYLFVFYSLLKDYEVLHGMSRGAAQNNLNLDMVKKYSISVPSLPIQRRIASILSAYDDLIENNLRRINLLEDAARQLYRDWFVRLRFPGYEHTKIVKGVPDMWEKGRISDFYYTGSGGTPSRKIPEYFTGDVLWVKTQELQNEFIIDTNEKITEAALNNSSARIFPKWSVLIAMYGATIGQLGILGYSSTTNQACCSLISKRKDIYYIFAYLFLRENKQNLVNLGQGSAQNNVNQEVIKDYEMIFPSKNIVDNFVESLEPSFNQILNLQLQNRKLKQARDILLPKLMSGEVEV